MRKLILVMNMAWLAGCLDESEVPAEMLDMEDDGAAELGAPTDRVPEDPCFADKPQFETWSELEACAEPFPELYHLGVITLVEAGVTCTAFDRETQLCVAVDEPQADRVMQSVKDPFAPLTCYPDWECVAWEGDRDLCFMECCIPDEVGWLRVCAEFPMSWL